MFPRLEPGRTLINQQNTAEVTVTEVLCSLWEKSAMHEDTQAALWKDPTGPYPALICQP